MSSRRPGETSAMEKLGARVRQRALTGFEASTVGFVLVACIGAGAGLGYLLDKYFETSFIVAVGTLLGAVLGFREMFRLTARLTRQSSEDDVRNMREAISPARDTREMNARAREEENAVDAGAARPRPRIFTVPPPPAASFEQKRAQPKCEPAVAERLAGDEGDPGSAETDVLERWLADGAEEVKRDEPPRDGATKSG